MKRKQILGYYFVALVMFNSFTSNIAHAKKYYDVELFIILSECTQINVSDATLNTGKNSEQ